MFLAGEEFWSPSSPREARQRLLEVLRYELLGPGEPEERLTESPISRYLTGMLAPFGTGIPPEEHDEALSGEDGDEEQASSDTTVPLSQALTPSSIGVSFLVPASTRQVDIVPLANAWRSGAKRWSRKRGRSFANDLRDSQLIAVSASSNRSKSDQGPEEWKPLRRKAWCLYSRWWVQVKRHWHLTVVRTERRALRRMVATC